MSTHWLIVRGALSFGVAMALTPVTTMHLPTSIGSAWVLGVVAGMLFLFGGDMETRTPLAFGCGFAIAYAIASFSLVSIQGGGQPEFWWGAIAGAMGWAFAGAIGGGSMRLGLLLPGAITFGLCGALAGYLTFKAIDLGYPFESMAVTWGFAGTIAGGLFGAAVAASSRRA